MRARSRGPCARTGRTSGRSAAGAFRQLLVAATHVSDAARQLRMYPKGRLSEDGKTYDYALVSAALGGANAAHRAAEPDLILDLGPRSDQILKI